MANWIGKARDSMEDRGAVGTFGKATDKKISGAMKKGGVDKKRAVFARNLKNIAQRKSTAGK